ncbi:MAG TPA: putative Ig domain-containing protein, partial [Burkholderiales bacterium]
DQAATEDQPFAFDVPAGVFGDADVGDSLVLTAGLADGSPLPSWLWFDGARFGGTPLNADVGSYRIRLTATDGAGAAASDDFQVVVANVNDAPVIAHAMKQQMFEAGTRFSFAIPPGTFADEDAGDTLTIAAASAGGDALPAWLRFDPGTATFSGMTSSRLNGFWPIELTATDASGASVSTDFGLVIYAQEGAFVRGDARDNILFGGIGDEKLEAKGGNDVLFGGLGNDTMKGGQGNDILQGGEGNDALKGGNGRELLDGGNGDDTIVAGTGSDLIVGGRGNDTIRTGSGSDVILFNRGDGADTVIGDGRGDNTLSLGGGIRAGDLSLSKAGKDLIVVAGEGDRIVLKDWYGGKHDVLNLQIIEDASAEFDDRRVRAFDFAGLARAFDAARMESPGLTSWALTNALMQHHLWSSDDVAFGGDLASWYAAKGTFAGMSVAAAQEAIGAPGFGREAHALAPFAGLQEGLLKLA